MKMLAFTYVSVLVCCLAYAEASEAPGEESGPQEGIPLRKSQEDVARRELTDAGYVIRYGDASYRYPLRIVPVVSQIQTRDPTETNEIETKEEKRPLFYFTTYESSDSPARRELPTSGPYIEIRKKREASEEEVQTPQKVNLRKKRTYCGKCGRGGGYGGYYVPVTYAVYPVYGGGHGGGGHGGGCNTCGGGHGGGGGGGGSFSYSSSSSHSSAGSFGWGKK